MWGTSGNLSVKLSSAPLAVGITGSGASKGKLSIADLALVPEEGRAAVPWAGLLHATPSAETAIHLAIYRALPDVGAIYHVHTVASTLLGLEAQAHAEGDAYLEVTDLEMLKGWGVEWSGSTLKTRIPVLRNLESMDALAADFQRLLAAGQTLPVTFVAGHGMTVWGRTHAEARNRLEIAEFISQVLWQRRPCP